MARAAAQVPRLLVQPRSRPTSTKDKPVGERSIVRITRLYDPRASSASPEPGERLPELSVEEERPGRDGRASKLHAGAAAVTPRARRGQALAAHPPGAATGDGEVPRETALAEAAAQQARQRALLPLQSFDCRDDGSTSGGGGATTGGGGDSEAGGLAAPPQQPRRPAAGRFGRHSTGGDGRPAARPGAAARQGANPAVQPPPALSPLLPGVGAHMLAPWQPSTPPSPQASLAPPRSILVHAAAPPLPTHAALNAGDATELREPGLAVAARARRRRRSTADEGQVLFELEPRVTLPADAAGHGDEPAAGDPRQLLPLASFGVNALAAVQQAGMGPRRFVSQTGAHPALGAVPKQLRHRAPTADDPFAAVGQPKGSAPVPRRLSVATVTPTSPRPPGGRRVASVPGQPCAPWPGWDVTAAGEAASPRAVEPGSPGAVAWAHSGRALGAVPGSRQTELQAWKLPGTDMEGGSECSVDEDEDGDLDRGPDEATQAWQGSLAPAAAPALPAGPALAPGPGGSDSEDSEDDGTFDGDPDGPDEATRRLLARVEIYERWGLMFEENRGNHVLALTFYLAVSVKGGRGCSKASHAVCRWMVATHWSCPCQSVSFQIVLNAIVPSVLLGIQSGSGMAPGSTAALAANSALLGVKVLYALYMTLVLPYINVVLIAAECLCTWLEVAVCACMVLITLNSPRQPQPGFRPPPPSPSLQLGSQGASAVTSAAAPPPPGALSALLTAVNPAGSNAMRAAGDAMLVCELGVVGIQVGAHVGGLVS